MTTSTAAVNNNTATLTTNWLETNSANYCVTYPWNSYTYTWYPGKVRLTLTEIEKLRAAAKKDKQIKEILSKFTNHIEIEVDFP